MTLFGMTDNAIAENIGDRLRELRLNRNHSQQEICGMTGLSIKAILNAEKGKSNIVTYIKILRALNCLDHLENFIPKPGISPMQMVKLSNNKRIRASRQRLIHTLHDGTFKKIGKRPTQAQGESHLQKPKKSYLKIFKTTLKNEERMP